MQPEEARASRAYRRKVTGILLVILFFVVYWPGGELLRNVRTEVFEWPFFILWAVVLAPGIVLAIFGYNAYRNNQIDKELEETSIREAERGRADERFEKSVTSERDT